MRFILPLIILLSGTASASANAAPVNFIGKTKDEMRKDISVLEYQILSNPAADEPSFRSSVRSYVMGCLMAASSEPYIRGTLITPDTRFGDIATIFLSDVAYCAANVRSMGEQLKLTDKLGEAVVVKEHAVLLNDLDFLSSPDTQITNAIQGCIDLGSLCFDVGHFACSQKAFAKAAHIMTSNNVENDELSSLITKVAASQFRAGNYSDAFDSYDTALKFLRKLGSTNKELMGSITSSMAATMFHQKNYLDAESTYKTALNHLKSVPHKNFKLIAAATKNLGSTLFAQRLWLDAVGQYEEALSLYVSQISDADEDPHNDRAEFRSIVDTVLLALSNAADDAAKGGDYREAHSLRERANKVSQMWTDQGKTPDKDGKFLNTMFQEGKESGNANIAGAAVKKRGFLMSLFVWIFRLIFAAIIAVVGYAAVSLVDWSKPVPPQIESIVNKLLQLVQSFVVVNSEQAEVPGASWASFPTPERYPSKGKGVGSSGETGKKHSISAPSPDRFFSQPDPKIVSPARKSNPSYIPSE